MEEFQILRMEHCPFLSSSRPIPLFRTPSGFSHAGAVSSALSSVSAHGVKISTHPHALKNDATLQNDVFLPTGRPNSQGASIVDLATLLAAQFDNRVRFRSTGQEQHGLFGNNDSGGYKYGKIFFDSGFQQQSSCI